MILILTSSTDLSTIQVIDWLNYFGKKHEIINELTSVDIESMAFNNSEGSTFKLVIDSKNVLESRNISSYWYRRHEFNVSPINRKDYLSENAYQHLKFEREAIHEYLNYNLDQKTHISSLNTQDINKLKCLSVANEVELLIPNTIVATSKFQIESFQNNENISTKVIQAALMFEDNNYYYCNYNNIVDKETISELPSFFPPSFIQQYIEKKIELRIFYLNEKCYSMAIFSQQNEKTKVDFRRYDYESPNRNVPYNLPKQIERKIIRFMKKVDLNSGSIDMILTRDNQYVFLEVNPIGQFGFVSSPCNYYLEKEIAYYLK